MEYCLNEKNEEDNINKRKPINLVMEFNNHHYKTVKFNQIFHKVFLLPVKIIEIAKTCKCNKFMHRMGFIYISFCLEQKQNLRQQ